MARSILLFASSELANRPVAGIPVAARAGHAIAQDPDADPAAEIVVAVTGGWTPTEWCTAELERLVPEHQVSTSALEQLDQQAGDRTRDGIALVAGGVEAGFGQRHDLQSIDQWRQTSSPLSEQTRILKALHASIIRSTGKQSDGLVSRYLNRPISRSISSVLLRFRSVRPIHATGLAALTGVLMAISLLFGGSEGLILGAFLFQAASVIDGVDGEMARATLRSSDFGAKLDTVTDGLTNLAFVAFASLNLWWQGERDAATYGAIGLAFLVLGLTMLGLKSLAQGGPFTFDFVKNRFHASQSAIASKLAVLTSRDVYAALFAITFVVGLAEWMLLAFAVAAGVWLATITVVLLTAKEQPN